MPTPTNPFRRGEVPRGSLFDTDRTSTSSLDAARAAYTAAQEAFEAKEKEAKEAKEKNKARVIAWAETAGKDAVWVEETFEISADAVHCGGNLNLAYTNIQELPPGLTVGGHLNLARTNIQELPPGLTVGGYLSLEGTKIQELPGDITVSDTVYLSADAPDTLVASCDAAKKDGRIRDVVTLE